MRTGGHKRAAVLSDEERLQLSALATSRSLPHILQTIPQASRVSRLFETRG
jgi:hypothetical protein